MTRLILLLALATTLQAQRAIIIDPTGDPAIIDPVTEIEYAEREAARPPPIPGPQGLQGIPGPVGPVGPQGPPGSGGPGTGTGETLVRTDAELHAAIGAGLPSVIPAGVEIFLSKPIINTQPGARLRGFGANSKLSVGPTVPASMDRMIHPKAPDFTISDLTINGTAGTRKLVAIFFDGLSRDADRFTAQRVHFKSCAYASVLTGGPGQTEAEILEDFQFLDNRVTESQHGGIQMSWEMLRPVILRNMMDGTGSDWNAIWLGLGVYDAHIEGNVLPKPGRMGIEIFYAHNYPTVVNQPGPSITSRLHPNGPSVTMGGNHISDSVSFGESLAGCKRSNLSGDTISGATSIGVEFIDEDVTAPSNYTASNYRIIKTNGIGVSIDKIKSGTFSNFLVDGAGAGAQLYHADDVTLDRWKLTGCGPRYLVLTESTRTNVVDSNFVPKAGEAFPDPEGGNFALYVYKGDCFFSRNILRGHATNPMRTALNGGSVVTSPTALPKTGYQFFDDPDNYRGRKFVP